MTIGPEVRHFVAAQGELFGWRVWRLSKGVLRSLVKPEIWLPGQTMTGDIRIVDRGVFAWNDPRPKQYGFYQDKFILFGTVWLWGDVIEHKLGYRATHGSIRSFDKFLPHPKLRGIFDLPPKINLLREKYHLEDYYGNR